MNEIAAQTNVLSTSELGSRRAGVSRKARGIARRVGFDLAYLVAVFVTSVVAFVVWVSTLTATVSLLVFVFGVVVWFASTYVFRWTTAVDRRLAGWSRGQPVRAVYRQPASGGAIDRLRCVTADSQTWRDLGWLMLNSVLGFAIAVAGLVATGVVVALILTPLWWWAVNSPGDQYGVLNLGMYTVHNTGLAFVNTAIGLALAPIVALANRGMVAGHSSLAARILGPRGE